MRQTRWGSTARSGIIVAIAAVLLSFASSCRLPAAPHTTQSPLRVGTSGDYPPFSSVGGAVLHGFDVDAARRLAEDFKRPLDFVPLRWPDLVEQLRAHEFDVAMSGVTIRRDRALHVRFSRPYLVTGAVAVIRTVDHSRYSSLDDLDHADVRVIVNRGGHLEQVARRFLRSAQVATVERNETLPILLSNGSADTAISEYFEARSWGTGFTAIGPFTRDRKAYAVPGDAMGLWEEINGWLAAREADGFLNTIRRRWLGEAAVITPQVSCFEAVAASVELRLSFMPLVAEAKRRAGVPIEVPEQEAHVLDRVRTAALGAGLHGDDVARIFRVLFDAAKAVQHHAVASRSERPGAERDGPLPSLGELRQGIAAASDALIAELARCRRWLVSPAERASLGIILRRGVEVTGQPPGLVDALLSALSGLRSSPGKALAERCRCRS